MFSFLNSKKTNQIPFKIQNVDGSIRKGVVADSLHTLNRKAKEYLRVKHVDRVVLESDGTEVDDEDYFHTLEPQTVFVILQKGEQWQLDKSKALESIIRALSTESLAKRELVHQLHSMLRNARAPGDIQLLASMTSALQTNIAANDRNDDPEWFKEIESRFKTKDDYMSDNARRRIRGYYYTATDFLKNNGKKDPDTGEMMKLLLGYYKEQLVQNDHYGYYFSRESCNKDKFCDKQGWFTCEGAFNEDNCTKQHVINPYANRSERIVFSTWNLDHQIEKSRDVLPSLWKALAGISGKSTRRKLNRKYFYDLLFTRENLRIVHVACHDKKEHSDMVCDEKKFYQ